MVVGGLNSWGKLADQIGHGPKLGYQRDLQPPNLAGVGATLSFLRILKNLFALEKWKKDLLTFFLLNIHVQQVFG